VVREKREMEGEKSRRRIPIAASSLAVGGGVASGGGRRGSRWWAQAVGMGSPRVTLQEERHGGGGSSF
jgi:hypothetical protein